MKAKVIDLFTRKEITESLYSPESASEIIGYLMKYESESNSDEDYKIIDNLLRMLENNSGVAREEVLKKGA
jgi:hypothetical protein